MYQFEEDEHDVIRDEIMHVFSNSVDIILKELFLKSACHFTLYWGSDGYAVLTLCQTDVETYGEQ